ncbi:MAG: NAD(P)-binding protein, partial [Actinomycetota bacterium]|nr:NAD(P)-binding protein [Actinomycetota bacterium]
MNAREPVIKDSYEVIVIGAGIGGLSAASILSQKGVEVLLIEQSDKPGGLCSSFKMDDFTFDLAVSNIQGFGEIGFHVIRTLFDFLNQQIELIPLEMSYSMFIEDNKIDLHCDRHAFTSEIGAIFPEQAGSIMSFLREMETTYNAVLDCSGPPQPGSDESALAKFAHFFKHPFSSMRSTRYLKRSARDVLSKYTDDPSFHRFLEADLYLSTGYRLSELSSTSAALALFDRHFEKAHYPIGSSQQIPDKLEKRIVENGGRIIFRTPVKQVIVKEGRARGVELANGQRIFSEVVISNIPVEQLYLSLIESSSLQPDTISWAKSIERTRSFFIFYGIHEDQVDEKTPPGLIIIKEPVSPHNYIRVKIPSLHDPNLSPEGFHSVCVEVSRGESISVPSGMPTQGKESEELLLEEAGSALETIDSYMPGLASPATKKLVFPLDNEKIFSSPSTIATGSPRIPDSLMPASLPGAVAEIDGLFLTGHSTYFGKGIAPACASGINCAIATLGYLGIKSLHFPAPKTENVLETVPVRPEISSINVLDHISAVAESHRCLRCQDPPCMKACPLAIDIPTVMRRVADANLSGAAVTFRESNPLAGLCGYLCPSENLCEKGCGRAKHDMPVKIRQIEEYLSSSQSEPGGLPFPFRVQRKEKIAVIGSGPAGISCAFFLSRFGYLVEMFEASTKPGGLLASSMPESELPEKVLQREVESALSYGIEFRRNTIFGEDVNFESLTREGFKAVFIGTGLASIKKSSIKGSDLPGVIDALSFLQAAKRKVKRELSENVMVIGDTSLAFDTAILALELGAKHTHLITHRLPNEITAPKISVERARGKGVDVIFGSRVFEIEGSERVEVARTVSVPGAPKIADSRKIQVGSVIIAEN